MPTRESPCCALAHSRHFVSADGRDGLREAGLTTHPERSGTHSVPCGRAQGQKAEAQSGQELPRPHTSWWQRRLCGQAGLGLSLDSGSWADGRGPGAGVHGVLKPPGEGTDTLSRGPAVWGARDAVGSEDWGGGSGRNLTPLPQKVPAALEGSARGRGVCQQGLGGSWYTSSANICDTLIRRGGAGRSPLPKFSLLAAHGPPLPHPSSCSVT